MMRIAFLPILAFALALSTTAARAAPPCSVPEDLALHDLVLPAAKQAAAASRQLTILTLGGAHTAGIAAEDPKASYPALLQAALAGALPGIEVKVVNNAKPGNTVDATLRAIPAAIAASGAKLVIWAPGSLDAVQRPNLSEFFADLQAGIVAIRQRGADVMLLDMQYIPLLEQWFRIEDYRDMLRGTAAATDVPLVQRHELMKVWSEQGALNLDATDKAEQLQVARDLFACMVKVLAAPIADAVR